MTKATEAGGDTSRRLFLAGAAVAVLAPPSVLWAQQSEIWSVKDAHDSLINDLIRLVDIRSREEWADTGVAQGAWPISLHEDRFPERLFAAREGCGWSTRGDDLCNGWTNWIRHRAACVRPGIVDLSTCRKECWARRVGRVGSHPSFRL